MRKLLASIAAVMFIGAIAAPASAAKAAKVTLFLHGNYPVGEFAELAGNTANGTVMVMDATEPTVPAPKSFGIFQPFNEQCTGNPLFPSWEGKVTGTIVGPIKVTAHFMSPGAKVRVRLWNDIPFSSCTSSAAGVDAYVDPKFETTVDVPSGHGAVDVLFKNKKLPVQSNLILEISQVSQSSQGRVLYDSPDMASAVQFNCSGC